MSSEEAEVWQREVDKVLQSQEDEEILEDGQVVHDRALWARNPAVRRGKGCLELFATDGGFTAAGRARGEWWCECAGRKFGKKGDFSRQHLWARAMDRIRNGIFFCVWICDPCVDGFSALDATRLVGEVVECCISAAIDFVVEASPVSAIWKAPAMAAARTGGEAVVFTWDWGAWGCGTKSNRKVMSSIAVLRSLRRCMDSGCPGQEAGGTPVRPMSLNVEVVEAMASLRRDGKLKTGLRAGVRATGGKVKPLGTTAWSQVGEWRLLIRGEFAQEEKISIAELRTITLSGRHAGRSKSGWFQKHLVLADSVPALAAAQKGRSKDFGALRLCRRLAGLVFGVGVRVVLRWVRSEVNWADGPSRGTKVPGVAPETAALHGA
jgi:hypothetical protein